MNKILTASAIILTAAATRLAGAEVNYADIFSSEEIRTVTAGAIITDVKYFGDTVSTGRVRKAGDRAAELFLKEPLKNFHLIASERAFIPLPKKKIPEFLKKLTSIKMLEDLDYYSMTENRVERFIKDVKVIRLNSKPDAGNSISSGGDIAVTDNRFGRMMFRTLMKAGSRSVIIENTTTESLSKFGFTVCERGDYRTYTALYYLPANKGFLYYSIHAMKIKHSGILKIYPVNPGSFGNRLRASFVRAASLAGVNRLDRLAAFREK